MLSVGVSGRGRLVTGVLNRREMIRVGAIGLGGLTLPRLLRLQDARAASPASGFHPKGRAKSAIILFLSGGPAHMDMWDMKPGAPEDVRGTFRPIETSVPGVLVSEHMPRMARLA